MGERRVKNNGEREQEPDRSYACDRMAERKELCGIEPQTAAEFSEKLG